jgi:hypothetical protein
MIVCWIFRSKFSLGPYTQLLDSIYSLDPFSLGESATEKLDLLQ